MNTAAFETPISLMQAPNIQPLMPKTLGRTCMLACSLAMILLASISQTAQAQIVQLPSLHTFSSSGSVLVPDGGTALLGGSSYARQGSTSSGFGPLSNQATAGSAGGSTLSASVQVIDLEALDRAILAGAAPRTTMAADTSVTGGPAPALASGEAVTGGQAASPGTDDSRAASRRSRLNSRFEDSTRQLSANATERVGADPSKWQRVLSGSGTPTVVNTSMVESNVRYYVELGQQAEKSGSVQAARVYYRLARQAMTPELVSQYETVLRVRAAEAAARKAELDQARRKF